MFNNPIVEIGTAYGEARGCQVEGRNGPAAVPRARTHGQRGKATVTRDDRG